MPARWCEEGCWSARFGVEAIIGTRKTSFSTGDGTREAMSPRVATEGPAARSCSTGRGRKLTPTLLETHNETSVAMVSSARNLRNRELMVVRVIETSEILAELKRGLKP